MFVLKMWADTSKLWKYMWDVLSSNFLNNQEAIMSDREVIKADDTKMPRIILQRAEEVFSALKESLVSVLYRKLIYQLVLWCLHYPVYIT